jgi:phosphoribosylformimino-5-aminoimidazole carboxamide ribonucleotide (ProFAR) isomerase
MKLSLGISLVKTNKGIGFTPVQKIVNAFNARVIAAGGVFRGKACLNAQLTILSNIE